MRTGLFCTYENPSGDYRAAYASQLKLVQHVENLGFDEAWIAEHHFNPSAASPSCLSVIAHLAGRTTRLRLGSAAVLLPFRNPLLVAEDVATADILSDGRFNFGVAKGGPFPAQNKHLGADLENRRAKLMEALELVGRLLEEDNVSFRGEFFEVDDVSLTPKPLQRPLPTFIATSTGDTVKLAADGGHGIMAGPPFPLDEVRKNLRLYRQIAPQGDPKLVLIRFYHLAPTRAQAMEEAAMLLRPFLERMQSATAALQPSWTPWFDMDRLIADSLIGTAAEVGEKARWLQAELRPQSLILKPIVADHAKQCADLETFATQIAHRLALTDA